MTNTINYNLRNKLYYPFSPVASFKFEYGYKGDQIVYLAKSDEYLRKKSAYIHYKSLILDYTYDNAVNFEMNLQIVSFFDIGSDWNRIYPWEDEVPLKKV